MQKFHAAKFRTVKFPDGETLPRRNFVAAKIPTVKIPAAKITAAKIPSALKGKGGNGRTPPWDGPTGGSGAPHPV